MAAPSPRSTSRSTRSTWAARRRCVGAPTTPTAAAATTALTLVARIQEGSTSKTVALKMDSDGKIRYDSIVAQDSSKTVFSRHTDLVPRAPDAASLARPSEEEVAETTERTRAALEQLISGKIAAARPSKPAEQQKEATYVRYTPSQTTGPAQQRVIKLVEIPADPLEPPKFKHKRVPGGPPSPPVPVMHSPPRKLSAKDHQDWNIPPCISSWKNPKGFTVPLDKRLAADGRGLEKPQISDKFAKFTEALYMAERKAREEVETRARIEAELARQQLEEKEQLLHTLAKQAREERYAS